MDQTRNHFQRNSSWNAPYTFSGKEKDVETGYGYFGARYYDSGLSIWLSVDPMSHALPHQSPFVYCSNNPISRIDKDGRLDTDWGLYPNGSLKQIGPTNDQPDVIYQVDANGEKIQNRRGDYNKIELSGKINVHEIYNMYQKNETNTLIIFDSYEDGKKLFTEAYPFFNRTQIEFSFYGYNIDSKDMFAMRTNHQSDWVIGNIPLTFSKIGELYFEYHYHFNSCFPSSQLSNGHPADREYRDQVLKNSPNAQIGIYYSRRLHNYSCTFMDFWR